MRSCSWCWNLPYGVIWKLPSINNWSNNLWILQRRWGLFCLATRGLFCMSIPIRLDGNKKKKNQARRLIYTRSLVGIKGGIILWMQMCWTFETSCLHVSHIYVLLPTSASFCFSIFLTLFSRIFAYLKFLCMESYTCFRATSNMNLTGITWELCCKVACITTLTTRSCTRKERKG